MYVPRIGMDNYGLFPLDLSPLQLLDWAAANGAEGVHFSGLPEGQPEPDTAQLKDMAGLARERDMYLEWGGGQHIPFNTLTWKDRDIFAVNRKAAEQAAVLGTEIVRSCSGGLFRLEEDSLPVDKLLEKSADALRAQRSMLKDNGVILAIETHFEFTSFELVRLFEICEAEPGDYLGICLDTMNLMVMLEDPIRAVERLLPWIVSTHIKDGGVLLGEDGLTVFPIETGRGIVDIQGIVNRLQQSGRPINLSVEDHGGSFALKIYDPGFLNKFPHLSVEEFSLLIQMAFRSRRKHALGLKDITTRPMWPAVCEERIRKDLEALKIMVNP